MSPRLQALAASVIAVVVPIAPALAQDRNAPHLDMPDSLEDVRDPRGPVGPVELATGRFEVEGEPVHDNPFQTLVFFDRLEWRSGEGNNAYLFDGFAFAGGDYNRIWVEFEGEGRFDGDLEAAELQVLYSRAITPYWNFQTGIRHDFKPEPELSYAVIGFEGLNVYWSGVNTNLYVSEDGDMSGDFEWEFDELLTQRLILQPRFETSVQFQDVPELGLGSGFTSYEAGLRLRYEFEREFAPYVGVSWAETVGETADLLPEGEDAGEFSVVAGLRFWF
ncbi:copper resistance protein B [uncultured Jannaschia sp.]|uniref:copper resistance protein B n=1 Tax=uncultured Jannaschia sp. TaxID=293347 RepID=UPI0026123CC1|nr:copper resistance protein B [uncultured Jannaschia sp.]